VVVDAKSNEITALPLLLKMLEIAGCLVTSDALGGQTEIAQAIVDARADYVLAVKGNQPTLPAGLQWHFFARQQEDFARVQVSRHQTAEKGHGRQETRSYFVCPVSRDLPDRQRWPKLVAIGLVVSEPTRHGKQSREERY